MKTATMIYGREVTYNGLLIYTSTCQVLLLSILIITYSIVYVHFLAGEGGRRYFTRANVREEYVYCMKVTNKISCDKLLLASDDTEV